MTFWLSFYRLTYGLDLGVHNTQLLQFFGNPLDIFQARSIPSACGPYHGRDLIWCFFGDDVWSRIQRHGGPNVGAVIETNGKLRRRIAPLSKIRQDALLATIWKFKRHAPAVAVIPFGLSQAQGWTWILRGTPIPDRSLIECSRISRKVGEHLADTAKASHIQIPTWVASFAYRDEKQYPACAVTSQPQPGLTLCRVST
jgi:hypothetical protein